ncbi:MAG: oxidoreductase [Actinomycetota bacterium]|nr:oxidoreductase [Actinomycetota bacterium]
MNSRWTAAALPDQSGRTVLVTGANSGLGFETGLELARRGARVLLACRDRQRGGEALGRLTTQVPDALAELVELDLSSLESVARAAEDVAARVTSLDVVVANAGVMAVPRSLTADGFEMQLGTNHLGHFALVGRLLPLLLAAPAPRVVAVSSEAHRIGRITFEDLMGQRTYRRWSAYGQSKLANLLYVRELQRRGSAAGLLAVAAHPGYAATNLQSGQSSRPMELAMRLGNQVLAQSAAQGAWPQLFAATSPDVVPGGYYGPGALGGLRGHPTLTRSTRRAQDDAVARRLWEVSGELTGVRYDFPSVG